MQLQQSASTKPASKSVEQRGIAYLNNIETVLKVSEYKNGVTHFTELLRFLHKYLLIRHCRNSTSVFI